MEEQKTTQNTTQNATGSPLATKKNILIGACVLGIALLASGIFYMTSGRQNAVTGAASSGEATISFDPQGNIYWNGEKISKEELDARVAASQN